MRVAREVLGHVVRAVHGSVDEWRIGEKVTRIERLR